MKTLRALILGMLLAACTADDRPPPPVGVDHQGIAASGGVSYDLLRDGAVFDQHDPRWGETELGASGETVGAAGCTLASVAMAAVNLGEDTDPGRLNQSLGAQGGFTSRGLLVWDGVRRASGGRVIAEYYDTPLHADIDQCLREKEGYPVVQFLLGGRVQHWTVIVGKADTRWLIRDPLYVTQKPIPLDTRAPSIRAVRCVRPGWTAHSNGR